MIAHLVFVATFVGAVVMAASGIGVSIWLFWMVLEGILSIEDRVLRIFKVHPALVRYLRNAKLYDKLIAEHKSKKEAA